MDEERGQAVPCHASTITGTLRYGYEHPHGRADVALVLENGTCIDVSTLYGALELHEDGDDGNIADGQTVTIRLSTGTDEIAQLMAERDEARTWVRRLTAATRVLTCAFCGEAYPPGTPETNDERLRAHVAVCAKHPMRESEAERARLQAAGDALAARLEEGIELVGGLLCSARIGWESARALAVAFGARATEQHAIRELADLSDAADGQPEDEELSRHAASLHAASLAHDAVSYVLQRAQEDADLGYLIGPLTQAFKMLCGAEAARLGRSLDETVAARGKSLARHPRRLLQRDEWEELHASERRLDRRS
jgi:hypothetical protein